MGSLCRAVHPNQPNNSGKARGRKVHKAKGLYKTNCNNNIESFIPKHSVGFYANKKRCKICFKN